MRAKGRRRMTMSQAHDYFVFATMLCVIVQIGTEQ